MNITGAAIANTTVLINETTITDMSVVGNGQYITNFFLDRVGSEVGLLFLFSSMFVGLLLD